MSFLDTDHTDDSRYSKIKCVHNQDLITWCLYYKKFGATSHKRNTVIAVKFWAPTICFNKDSRREKIIKVGNDLMQKVHL